MRKLVEVEGYLIPDTPSEILREYYLDEEKKFRANLWVVREVRPAFMADAIDAWAMPEFGYQYWEAQHITRNTIDRFGIGWHPVHKRYTIPWYYREQLVGVKMRRDDNLHPRKMKYISLTQCERVGCRSKHNCTCPGSRYGHAPYNWSEISHLDLSVLLICEDEKSVWAARQLGFAAISYPANAWRAEFSAMIAHVDKVVICRDRDEAGLRYVAMFHETLPRAGVWCPNVFNIAGNYCKDLFDAYQVMDAHRLIDDILRSR